MLTFGSKVIFLPSRKIITKHWSSSLLTAADLVAFQGESDVSLDVKYISTTTRLPEGNVIQSLLSEDGKFERILLPNGMEIYRTWDDNGETITSPSFANSVVKTPNVILIGGKTVFLRTEKKLRDSKEYGIQRISLPSGKDIYNKWYVNNAWQNKSYEFKFTKEKFILGRHKCSRSITLEHDTIPVPEFKAFRKEGKIYKELLSPSKLVAERDNLERILNFIVFGVYENLKINYGFNCESYSVHAVSSHTSGSHSDSHSGSHSEKHFRGRKNKKSYKGKVRNRSNRHHHHDDESSS